MADDNSIKIVCPTCGHPVGRDPRPVIEGLYDGTIRYAMLKALADQFGEWVPRVTLEALVYPGHDGGPLSSRQTLHVYAYENRKRLHPYGLTIEGMRAGQGAGAYRLRWTIPQHDGRDWLPVDKKVGPGNGPLSGSQLEVRQSPPAS